MIHKIEINNSNNSPFPYIDLSRGGNFNLQSSYTFTKGVNVIVGANGSGKSTLLDIIRSYTLCDKSNHSRLPKSLLSMNIFSHNVELLDGINVQSNYGCSTFNLRGIEDNKNSFNSTDYGIRDFAELLTSTSLSKGQQNLLTIENMFKVMFDEGNSSLLHFPIKDISDKVKSLNSDHPWYLALNSLLSYYMSNNIPDEVVSVLMDEPEQNLDLYNTSKLFGILSHKRDDTQIICSIHNPLLIYRLSKLSHVNFIELTDGYIEDIVSFVNGDVLEYDFMDGKRSPDGKLVYGEPKLDNKGWEVNPLSEGKPQLITRTYVRGDSLRMSEVNRIYPEGVLKKAVEE